MDLDVPLWIVKIVLSYVTDRKCVVDVKGAYSQAYVPTSEVPQESNLGSLLFITYAYDFNQNLLCKLLMYADNAKLFPECRSAQDCKQLQESLDAFVKHCEDNKLTMNESKCCMCSFTRQKIPILYNYKINGLVIKRANFVNDLGIMLNSNLNFNLHIDSIICAAKRILGVGFRFCKRFEPEKPLIISYKSFFRPKLKLGIIACGNLNKNNVKRLENIQRKALKYAEFIRTGVYPERGSDCSGLYSRYKIGSLYMRRQCMLAQVGIKIINGKTCVPELSEGLTSIATATSCSARRIPLPFYPPVIRSNLEGSAPVQRISKCLNRLVELTEKPLEFFLEYNGINSRIISQMINNTY